MTIVLGIWAITIGGTLAASALLASLTPSVSVSATTERYADHTPLGTPVWRDTTTVN